MTLPSPDGRRRVVIEAISPEVDGGRFPAKRTVGDQVRVEADIFTDGHDLIAAALLVHREGSDDWTEIPMRPVENDRWAASFRPKEIGRYGFKVEGWVDHFDTWCADLKKRLAAQPDPASTDPAKRDLPPQDIPLALTIGAAMLEQTAARAKGSRTHAAGDAGLVSGVTDGNSIALDHGRDCAKIQLVVIRRISARGVHQDEVFFAQNFDGMVDLRIGAHSSRKDDWLAGLAHMAEQVVVR